RRPDRDARRAGVPPQRPMNVVEQRAAARVAWRYARKAKARTALILFLIALPIAALVATGIMITTVYANPQDKVTAEMGSADLEILDQGPDGKPVDVATVVPSGSLIDNIKGSTAYKVAGGTLLTLDVTENSVPPDQPPSATKYKLLAGRMPHSDSEAAIPP